MRAHAKFIFSSLVLTSALALDSACSTQFDPLTCSSDAQCGTGLACLPEVAGGPNYCTKVQACASDNDCANNLACVPRGAKNICGSGADFPITVGQSAPQTGPSKDLGLEMNRGVVLAFNEANTNGGIRGRQVNIDFIDDQYTPALAEQNVRKLVDVQTGPGAPHCPTTTTPPVAGQDPFSATELLPGPNAVLAVIGSVGTPTMVRSAPVVVETGRLYFGAFTGAAAMLRDDKAGPCKKYIFNVRASYGQEARATLEYFFKLGVPDDTHLVSFDQNDTFGDAGYNGLVAAYTAIKGAPGTIKRFRYTRDDVNSVPAQSQMTIDAVKALLATPGNHTVGIMMTDTYGPGAQYIKALRDWQYGSDQTAGQATRVRFLFSNVSFVGPNSLAARLKELGTLTANGQQKPYTEDVYVSQVMPNYSTDTSAAVLQYKKLLADTGAQPTYTSFEGYVVGRIFVEGLRANRQAFTPDNLVAAFESLATLNIGLGGFIGFSAATHQASKSIWGTAINPDGTFSDKYFWSDGAAIQLVE